MELDRYSSIDFLRAVAIFGVIAIHVFSLHLSSWVNIFLWNYLQFVVGAFILCSGYVLFARYKESFKTVQSIFVWYKKRLFRLLIPYYTYLVIHIFLIFTFPRYFSGIGFNFSSGFWFNALFLTGGANHNWLVLLFVQLTIVFPFLIKYQKFKIIYFIFSLVVSFIFTFYLFPYQYYRLVMWIPWSTLIYGAIFLSQQSGLKKIISVGIISGVVYFILNFYLYSTHHLLKLIDNKYPPNIYYLSYALFVSVIILLIGNSLFLRKSFIKQSYEFISRKSYELFFVHFIVLDFIVHMVKLKNSYEAFVQLFMVLSISVVLVYVLDVGKLFIEEQRGRKEQQG